MKKSIGVRGDYSRTPTTDVGNYFSDRDLREEFSALISGYTARQLSSASGCTIDAAKMWLAGKRVPSTASTFNMARRLPAVSEWALAKIGVGSAAEAQKRILREIVADEVRTQIKRPPAESERDRSSYSPDGAIYNLFPEQKAKRA